MISRIQKLRQEIANNNLDGMIITDPISIYYLTGIDVKGILLITKEDNIYITYQRYVMHVNSLLTIDKQVIVKVIEKIFDYSVFFEADSVLGIEEQSITFKEYTKYKQLFKSELVPFGNSIISMRSVKDNEEIASISNVSKKLDDIYSLIVKGLKVGISEKDIYLEVQKLLKINMLELYEVPKISFGKNTSKQYLKPTNNRLKKDDIIIISITAKDKNTGYLSTIGRTIFFGNILDKNPKMKEQYLKLYNLHDEMLREIKNGNNIYDKYMQMYFELERINWNISYQTFRSIGLDNDEIEIKKDGIINTFKENMVLILEPIIYVDDEYGLLIQDTIQITQTNHILLTKSNRNYNNERGKNV
ncbi:MAG: M24 family metallopeptidase [Clostridium sp.]